jgi:hypothetical protein
MNDFVMSVVNEVLHKSDLESSNEVLSSNLQLVRPNYQRQNEKKRLMVYDIPPVNTAQSNEMQALRLTNLSAGALSGVIQSETLPRAKQSETLPEAKQSETLPWYKPINHSLGTNANNLFTENRQSQLFSEYNQKDFTVCSIGNNQNLKRLFGFPYSTKDAACIGMQENCYITQLFTINEILSSIPALDFTVKWSLNYGEPFVFQAIGTMDWMETAAEILNKKCIQKQEILMVQKPGNYLKKTLNNSTDAFGTIEGVHYAKLLSYVADYNKRHKECMVEYQIFGSYLIVSGQIDEVQQVLQSMVI